MSERLAVLAVVGYRIAAVEPFWWLRT